MARFCRAACGGFVDPSAPSSHIYCSTRCAGWALAHVITDRDEERLEALRIVARSFYRTVCGPGEEDTAEAWAAVVRAEGAAV